LTLSSAASSAGAAAASGVVAQPGGELPHVAGRPSVDYVWRARETMSVEYGGRNRRVTVYRHTFPGSTLWMDFWDRVEGASWEEDTLNIFEWYLSRDKASVLVDFGSWIGPSVLWGGLFASRVYSIEPDPVSFSTLVANINANPETAAKTSVFWRCIAPKDGDVDMAGSGESNTRMVGVLDTMFLKAGSRWTVPCITLPNFLAEQRIDVAHLQLIKMDTEGTELWLLPTLRPWLESLKDRKPAFWLSVHSPFWLQKKPEELQAAWDVMALFAFVYDQNLKRIYPAKMKASAERRRGGARCDAARSNAVWRSAARRGAARRGAARLDAVRLEFARDLAGARAMRSRPVSPNLSLRLAAELRGGLLHLPSQRR
jgi:FkbM family methyltransferase